MTALGCSSSRAKAAWRSRSWIGRRRQASHAGPEQYSQGGYEATFGRFEVDARTNTFTYYVEGSLVRTLVGKALPRLYEFKGKQLIVKSANPAERWRAVWEHY